MFAEGSGLISNTITIRVCFCVLGPNSKVYQVKSSQVKSSQLLSVKRHVNLCISSRGFHCFCNIFQSFMTPHFFLTYQDCVVNGVGSNSCDAVRNAGAVPDEGMQAGYVLVIVLGCVALFVLFLYVCWRKRGVAASPYAVKE